MAGADGDQGGTGLPEVGWYTDPKRPDREQLWDGERWRAVFRPVVAGRQEATPVGWYPDPASPVLDRLWDGEQWTGARRPSDAPRAGAGAGGAAGQVAKVRYLDANPPQPITLLGRFVIAALGLTILTDIAVLVTNQHYIGYVNDRLDFRPLYLDRVQTAITQLHTTHVVYVVMFLVAAALFGTWFFRAYRNLVRGGIQDVRHGTGWAVGGWLIPIFSWIRPKEIADDLWRGSGALADRRVEGWRGRGVSPLIHWWWGFWVVATIVVFLGRTTGAHDGETFYYKSPSALRSDRVHLYFGQAGLVLEIAAATLAIAVVWRISELQDAALSGFDPNARTDVEPAAVEVAALGALATKTCPECAEDVKAAARKCRYCGYRFDDPV